MDLGDIDMDGYSNNEGDDSNAILLVGKKKSKRKVSKQDNMKKPQLSKSQKRKLKKLEEEKEKAVLLTESIKTIEKYKIREDAHSLLKSSGNIGQVETMREKRLRAVKFSKIGLSMPEDDRPSKKRVIECDSGHGASDIDESDSKLDDATDNILQPVLKKREEINDGFGSSHTCQDPVSSGLPNTDQDLTSSGLPTTDADLSTLLVDKELLNMNKSFALKGKKTQTINLLNKDHASPLLAACSFKGAENTKSQDKESHDLKEECKTSHLNVDSTKQRIVIVPTVVHVSRPIDVENKRKDLPIVMMEQEIMEAINENSVVIVCGETGCGKTTQVPQFLYEAGYGSRNSSARSGVIGVTQPRRVAVLSTARRVAFELGFRLGREVGFQVRYDKRIGDNCSIKFMTDGILLREVQNDILLKRYSVIVLDEAHERSLNTDILIGMLSRSIGLRQSLYKEQQKKLLSGVKISPENMLSQLKVVIMSATLRVEDFISERKLFCEVPPVIEVPARQFPVTIHFAKRTEMVDYISQAYKKIISIHKRLPPGGILVFVTGQREVEYLCQKLRSISRERTDISSGQKSRNGIAATSEANSIEQELDMKDINEAFEILGHSTNQQTDRFSGYDEDPGGIDAHDSYSDDPGSDSELISDDDSDYDEGFLDHKSPENGGELDVFGNTGSLTALKAAFDALAGKTSSPPNSNQEKDLPASPAVKEECLNLSLDSEKNGGESNAASIGKLCVLPLYAMLPAAAQLRVFEEVKEGDRLVVVATNVAETSLTIPGIKYVVDTGREKVKKYNPTNGMETYEIQWISKASASQRAGRSGRTGPGHCYRLYSSAVFSNIFSDFSIPEIFKIPVDGVVLLMKSMGIGKVGNFPFPTPPETSALLEAVRCLKALEALDTNGRLTPLGKAMAQYPMSPRHSRMLLTAIQIMNMQGYSRANLVLGYTVSAAAALSLSNPFIKQFEGSHTDKDDLDQEKSGSKEDAENSQDQEDKLRQKKLKQLVKVSRAKFSNLSSDALTVAYALQLFELAQNPVEFCKENTLHLKTMEEMSKLRKQLLQLVFHQKSTVGSQQEFLWIHGTLEDVEQAWKAFPNKHPLLLYEEEILGQAICAGWVDRVAKRTRVISGASDTDRRTHAARYQACIVKETVFLHRWSSLAQSAPDFLVYNELLQTKRPYLHGVTRVKSDWLIKYARSMCSFPPPTMESSYYDPFVDVVLYSISPAFGPHLWQLPNYSLPVEDRGLRICKFAFALLKGHVLPCLRSVQEFLADPATSVSLPGASGQRRVVDLLKKLNDRSIDSRAMLRKAWEDDPQELHSEILDWFKKGYRQFETLWKQMHKEVLMDPQELFPETVKKRKRKSKKDAGRK